VRLVKKWIAQEDKDAGKVQFEVRINQFSPGTDQNFGGAIGLEN
jgi:hypothetical protein